MFENYFDIDSILSYIKQAPFLSGLDEKAVGGLNGLLNILFGIGKSIVLAAMYLVKNVYSVDIVNNSIDKVFSSSEGVWDSLFKTLGVVFLTILFIYGIKDLIKYGMQKIFVRLLIFGSLVIVATGFYSNGASWLKDINTISGNAQNELVAVMAPDISKDTDKLVKDLGLTPPEETTDKVNNMLYYKFILEPLALYNYGKTDITKGQYTDITAKKGKYNDDKVDAINKKVEEGSEKNAYFTGKKLGDKYLILLNSGIDFTIVAGIILLISVMNFLVQIFILALVLISPIWVALSLLPDNEHIIANGMKLILSAFGLKIALGIGFGFVFMILNFINSAFGLTSITAIVASLIIKIILAFLVAKNIHWFKNAITKAEVDRLPDVKPSKLSHSTNRKESNPKYGVGGEGERETRESLSAGENGSYNKEYADNVQMQSSLDDSVEANAGFGENIMRGIGYASARGFGSSVLDKVGDKAKTLYEDSKLQSAVEKTKEFTDSPSGYVQDRLNPYSSAYNEGQIDGLNKKYGVNSYDDVRIQGEEEEDEKQKERNRSKEFEAELTSLRGDNLENVDVPVHTYDDSYASTSYRDQLYSDETDSYDRENIETKEPNVQSIEQVERNEFEDIETDALPEEKNIPINIEREDQINEIDS